MLSTVYNLPIASKLTGYTFFVDQPAATAEQLQQLAQDYQPSSFVSEYLADSDLAADGKEYTFEDHLQQPAGFGSGYEDQEQQLTAFGSGFEEQTQRLETSTAFSTTQVFLAFLNLNFYLLSYFKFSLTLTRVSLTDSLIQSLNH